MTIFDKRLLSYLNWGLIGTTLLLFAIGAVNLYSASRVRMESGIIAAPFFERQLIWGGIGCLVMLPCTFVDYRRLHRFAWPFFVISLFCLALVPICGKIVYGARRWIDLGLFHFQPSEMAKFAVLLMGAQFLSNETSPLSWKRLGIAISIGLIPGGFIVMQPDLGTALTCFAILGGMILYHGIEKRVFLTCLVVVPLILPAFWFTLHDYQKQRIMTLIDPSSDPRGSGYHIIQSQIAIGSGKIWGNGFMEGTQSQLRFLPEKHTDFAVAVFGEEWGFAGCVTLMTIFSLFLLTIFSTVRDARDRFGSTLAAGVLFYFFWQIFVNTGMVVGIMPVVGIPLPFLSYGGSATIINFALIGLVLNISMHRFLFRT